MMVREYFEKLTADEYEVLASRVRRSVSRFVGIDDAQDVLHDVFLMRAEYPLITEYAESMVVNLCKSRAIDVYRYSRRRGEMPYNDAIRVNIPAPIDSSDFDDLVGVLPVKYRAVLKLHYFYRYQFNEIGVMMGLSEGAVKQYRNRGVALLAGKYGVNLD